MTKTQKALELKEKIKILKEKKLVIFEKPYYHINDGQGERKTTKAELATIDESTLRPIDTQFGEASKGSEPQRDNPITLGNPKKTNLEKALGLLENTKLTGNMASTTIWILGPNGERVNSNLDQHPIVRGTCCKFVWLDASKNSLKGYRKFEKEYSGIIDVERDDTPDGPHYTIGELVLAYTKLEEYEDKKNEIRRRGIINSATAQNRRIEEARSFEKEPTEIVINALGASLSKDQAMQVEMLKANGNGMTHDLAMETVTKSYGGPVQF